MTDFEKPEPQRADHVHTVVDFGTIVQAADDVQTAFHAVELRIEAEARKRFVATVVQGVLIGVVTIMLIVGFITLDTIERDRLAAAKAACERGNESREAIVNGIHGVIDGLVAATTRPRSPDEQANYDRAVATFRSEVEQRLEPLEPREC